MSLKAYLQALLDKRTTKDGAAHSSTPSWMSVPTTYTGTDVDDNWGTCFSGVMPSDGVLVVTFTGTQTTSHIQSFGNMCLVPWAMGGGLLYINVGKGTSVALGGNHVSDVVAKLYPLNGNL